MGNTFTARCVDTAVSMSNVATSVFCDVVALAGSTAAATAWQQRLTLHFCDSERHSSGASGFDLSDLPWTADHAAEKEFFLHVLDRAVGRHGWDALHYDPIGVRDRLLDFRLMLAAFTPHPVTGSWLGDWTVAPPCIEVDRCVRHRVFRGDFECRLCDVSIQPRDAPTVWELVSLRTTDDGRTSHREVVQVPDAALPALRRRVDPVRLDPAADARAAVRGTATRRPLDPVEREEVESALGRPLDTGLEHHLRIAIA